MNTSPEFLKLLAGAIGIIAFAAVVRWWRYERNTPAAIRRRQLRAQRAAAARLEAHRGGSPRA